VIGLGLAVLVAASYGAVGAHEFLYCDDDSYVFQNPVVSQGLGWVGVKWAFVAPHVANWHPLSWLSHMLDVSLFGLDAGWHHWVSVALHAANALLLFVLLRQATGALWAPAFVAALFACHPLHVESVAWVAERKDVLSGLFFLLTLGAWFAYARRPGSGRYAAVLILFALALLSKSMTVTIPGVLLLLDVWPLGRTPLAAAATPAGQGARASWTRLVAEKLPLLALSAVASAVAVVSQRGDDAMGDLATLPFAARVGNAISSIVAYLGKTLWPTDLAIFYPHPALIAPAEHAAIDGAVFGTALLLLAVTAFVMAALRSRPYLAVGWLWYLGMLVPVLGLVQVGEQSMADRYTYLPLIGLTIAAAWGLRDLAAARPWTRPVLFALAPLLLVACLGLSRRQVSHWRNTESVFEHALAVTTDNYFAHNHLGRAYENAGKLEPAIAQYREAIRIRPSAGALSNLGNALAKNGDPRAAVASFEAALALDPGSANAHGNLGVVRGMLGEPEQAISSYERALALDPEHSASHYNLGSLLLRRGELERGAKHLERALELNPFHADATHNLGAAHAELGRPELAVAAYERALELDPEHPGTLCNLGRVYEQTGEAARAVARYEQAVQRDPGCRHGHRFLGYRYFESGDLDRALLHLEAVLRLDPSSADAHNDVGSVYARKRDARRASAHFEQALRLDPGNAVARNNLTRLRSEFAPAASREEPAR
jgi:tetratricopeptide (TPR) repeat protein